MLREDRQMVHELVEIFARMEPASPGTDVSNEAGRRSPEDCLDDCGVPDELRAIAPSLSPD